MASFTVASTIGLIGCGGGSSSGSSSASVRLVNATLSHASLDLVINSGTAGQTTTLDTVSSYATPASGASTLQVNDTGSTTGLAVLTPTLTGGAHYSLVAYESAGTVKTVALPEDWTIPAAGAATLRINDLASEAGKLDVYISASPINAPTDLTTQSPVGAFAASGSAVISLTYSPGTYYANVTAGGNPLDVRLLNMPVTLTSQEVASIVLTPASGGALLNGSLLVQQGAYSASRNTSTRVRLASAVSGNATVAAIATTSGGASVTIDSGSVSPQFDGYVLLPTGSTMAITVNGSSVSAPAASPVKGADMTLLVYGAPGAASASLLLDDNRPPTDSSAVKLRLINGITGNSSNLLTLTANSAVVASGIAPQAASTYTSVASSLNPMNLSLSSTQKSGVYYTNSSYVLSANSVYTVLATGDFSAPFLLIH